MKKCPKCLEEKAETEFGKDRYSCDGFNVYCKPCIRKRSKKQRLENQSVYSKYFLEYRRKNAELLREKAKIEYYLNYEKRREQSKKSYEKHKEEIAKRRAEKRRTKEAREKNRNRQREWQRENVTKAGRVTSEWKKKNPQKSAAHALVCWATKTGILKRSDVCEECGIKCKTQGHHEDYMKPMDVIWVCKDCHSKKHRIYR